MHSEVRYQRVAKGVNRPLWIPQLWALRNAPQIAHALAAQAALESALDHRPCGSPGFRVARPHGTFTYGGKDGGHFR